jgi:hypothetical protein
VRGGCAPDGGGSPDRRGCITEIVAFTGGAALPPRTGTMVTMGFRPLSGTSVPAVGDLLSSRPTMSSELRWMSVRLQVRHMWEAVRYGDVNYYECDNPCRT